MFWLFQSCEGNGALPQFSRAFSIYIVLISTLFESYIGFYSCLLDVMLACQHLSFFSCQPLEVWSWPQAYSDLVKIIFYSHHNTNYRQYRLTILCESSLKSHRKRVGAIPYTKRAEQRGTLGTHTKPDPRSVPMAPENPPALVTVPADTDFSRGIAPTPGAYGHGLLLMTFLIAFGKEKNIQAQKQIKITSHIFCQPCLALT